ncbi:membrane protein insertase YidC [Marinimicrobium alkaliphilum]|uniref:membrane protein insertase YidC n=1 Tax=Marinimicrobium alkaliphilum TaxID=2202654 RepID=UPI000DBA0C0E|nr:membrane protein insertase YidC [Marinimicrobium alkaliphilum]
MDWQKPLLIAAMGAIVFTLILRWADFQDAQQAETPRPSATAPATQGGDNDALPEEPSDAGIPRAPEDASDDVTPTVAATTAPQRPIEVRTDTLNLTIDPRGGDIVRLSLPQHYDSLDTPDVPFTLLRDTEFQTYVSQSGLIGPNGTDTAEGRPVFHSDRTEFELADGEDTLEVDLHYQAGDVSIIKRYRFTRGDYLIELEYLIDNQSDQPWRANLYGQIKRDALDHNPTSGGMFTLKPYLGPAMTTNEDRYNKINFSDLRSDEIRSTVDGGWVAMVQHYFVSAWVPDQQREHNIHLRRMGNRDLYLLGFTSPRTEVAPGETGVISAGFYAGPKYTHRLEEIAPYLDLTVDYGWLWWLAKPLFWLLNFIHGFVGNWGLAIIALTVVIKAAFFKLSATSYRSMAKMRKLSPKMQELKERYGSDRQKMSQELMKLYKKEKVNPLGGCLPILVQMPVFLALYWVLMESVELRHAPFFAWIVDLSVRDPYFILPILMGGTMFIQFKLNPTPPDPTQAKVMQMMPIIFTFLFLWFPAGLVLYWLTNNTLSIAQQYVITRQIEGADEKKA